MGAGAAAFLGADMKKGIDMILDMIRFEDLVKGCDVIFTGEGRIDAQSMGGKAVIGISGRAKAMSVPVIAVVGEIGDGIASAYEMGVTAIFSTNHKAVPFEIAKRECKNNLRATMENILRLIKTTGR
jgi:glycerate kinase